MSKDFVHLHVHTCYSLLDGLTKIPELFDKVAQLNQSAVAITDHGAMYAMVDAAKYAQKNNQHFIPGCEVYWVPDATVKDKSERSSENDASRKHFLLLAKNNEGYKRLMKICSWGCSDGYYYRPRIDDSIFEKYGTDGIIAASACFVPSDNLDVLTKDGIKLLTDIKSGDEVWTHTGQWQKVISPTTRKYAGSLYTVKIQGKLEFTVTKDHKFYIVRDNQLQVVKVQDLQNDDQTIMPIDETIKDIDYYQYRVEYAGHRFQDVKIPINSELIELIGIYAQYGSSENMHVRFIFNKSNNNYQIIINRIQELINKLFNINDVYQYDSGKYIELSYNNKIISQFFRENFHSYDTHNFVIQHLPSFLKYLPFDKQDDFIHKVFSLNHTYSSFNKNEIYDMIYMLNRVHINFNLEYDEYKFYKLTINPDIQNNIININNVNYILSPIKVVHYIEHCQERSVYCLNVENDHSFAICNIISHNCLAGIPAQKLLHGDYKGAKESIQHYAKMFKDGYYIEIQPTEDERQVQINKGLIELSKELGIPCIATTDAHYLNKEDKAIHDILLCIQSGAKIKDPNRWSFSGNTYYIMSRDEIAQAFQCNGHESLDQQIIEEAMNNTVDVANQCQVNFTFGKHYLPKVSPPSEEENPELMRQYNVFETRRIAEVARKNNISMEDARNRLDPSSEYFRFLLIHGWHGLYAQGLLDERHLSLMFYETDVVLSMDFPSYFLILHDILSYCNTNGIGTGPARGCFQCNTLISLKDEQKYIQDINIDDKVLTYDDYHKVLNKYEYDCDEDIIEIQTESNKIEGITKDHKVLGIRAKDYIPDKDYSIEELKWIAIDDLQEGDYLIQY